MKIGFAKLCRAALIATVLVLPCGAAQAGIVSTQDVAAHEGLAAQRERVREFMAREDVADKLVELGVAADLAKKRAEALTDEEVVTIAGKIDKLPAGGALRQNEVILLLLLIIVLLIAL
jgi:hypothetical protein